LFGSFPWYGFPKEADFASEGIDLNDLTSLLNLVANVGFELNATVDQVLDKSLFASGVTGNSLLPQFLVTLPVLPWEFWLARTTFLKTA
jgi:hypothetical protein